MSLFSAKLFKLYIQEMVTLFEEGIKLKRSCKIYEFKKLTSSVKYQHDTSIREKPLTHKQKINKREITEL